MSDDLLLVEEAAGVVTLTLNRPDKRNALSLALLEQMRSALDTARTARVVVVRGNGPIFCAGLDLKEAADAGTAEASAATLADVYERLANGDFASLCVAHGGALGGGAGFVLACDLTVADEGFQLAFPELRRGIVPALVAALLARRGGDGLVRSMLLTGRAMSAQDAKAAGLLHEVAGDDLQHAVDRCIADLLQAAPATLGRTKRLLRDLAGDRLRRDFELAQAAHVESRHGSEFIEGTAAFRDKRPPSWVMDGPHK